MKLIKNILRLAVAGTGLVILTFNSPDIAATTNVLVGAGGTDTFSPSVVNIKAGDRIIWSWQGNFHTTTSGSGGTPDGLWDSGTTPQNTGYSFTNTLSTPGSYPYFCRVHVSFNMTGVVNVASAPLPPAVSITNPPDGLTLSAPASFTLAATASDPDGTITGVQFFQGPASLGTVASSPYSVAVNSLSAGDYLFSAVATDNGGLTATNAITVHVVTATPIVLNATQFFPPSDFQFNYTANSGLKYIVQRSGDLSVWTTISTNQASGSPVIFDDTNATTGPSFYRVGRLPNP